MECFLIRTVLKIYFIKCLMSGLLKINVKFSFNKFKCLVEIEIVVNLSFNILNVWSSKKNV